MDPRECLNRIQEALNARDFDEVEEHAENLETWVLNGGFLPEPVRLFLPPGARKSPTLGLLIEMGVCTTSRAA